MKVTQSWLKDFVEIKLSPKALADNLTMAGLEVTSLEEKEGDFVFEIEVTSNRPDWLSVIGIAREVGAITGKKLKALQAASCKLQAKTKSLRPEACGLKPFSIQVENRKDCPLYTATIIEGVKVVASPEWMQKRLRAIGLRPINNIVDITNYVLYETGQPLHAFDLDKIIAHQRTSAPAHQLEIVVRRAKNGEEITTIDGVTRKLDTEILVIADSDRPIAIAGIIGGKDTEVSEETKNILLESAGFSPTLVRRGARKLGVSTDSSYRFERKVDPQGVTLAAQRAAELITKLAGGKISYKCQSVKVSKCQEKKIKLSIEKSERILGIALPTAKIKQILAALGFKLATCSSQFVTISVPSFRQDVSIEEDLIEEIARIYGYGRIPSTLPYILPQFIEPLKLKQLAGQNPDARLTYQLKNILTASGFSEVINYSLNPLDALKKNKTDGLIKPLAIENPLSKEQEILRPDLFFGLLNNSAYNLNRKNNRLKIFEVGRVFTTGKDIDLLEKLVLGLAVCGRLHLDWQSIDKRQAGLFDLKSCLEQVFSKLGIGGTEFIAEKFPLFRPGASFAVRLDNKKIGLIGEVDNFILENYDIKQKNIFAAQVYLQDLAPYCNFNKKFKPYSLYPSIRRDISLLVKKDIPYGRIKETINSCPQEGISCEAVLLEQYSGKQVPEGFQNLLISLEYSSFSRTLKDTEIDAIHREIIDKAIRDLGAKIR